MAREARRDPFDPSRFDFEDSLNTQNRRQVHFGPAVYLKDELDMKPFVAPTRPATQRKQSSTKAASRRPVFVQSYWLWLSLAVAVVLLSVSLAYSMATSRTHISQPVQEQIEQAVRIALKSTVQRHDYALVQEGARVIPRLTAPNDTLSTLPNNAPENALQDPTQHRPPCWSFSGSRGQIGIRLSQKIVPTYIALDMAYPTVHWSQAPYQVILWGVVDGISNYAAYETDLREYRDAVASYGTGPAESLGFTFLPLANFDYDASAAFPLQTYRIQAPIASARMVFGVVVVEVFGNWGGERTSICGLRIYGEPV